MEKLYLDFLIAIPAVPASIIFKRSTGKRRALSVLEKREISRGSTMFFTSATDLPTVLEYFRHCGVFQNLSLAIQAHQHTNRKQQTLHEWLNSNSGESSKASEAGGHNDG